jgi:AraC-like DNA-binding protein
LKPLIQKLPLASDTSFVAKTFRTPHFEVPWHQHIEYELILLTKGHGMCFIGNYVGPFEAGDVFFIGSNVPHTFQKQEKGLRASAVVVQFKGDFWGADFLKLPENKALCDLFALSMRGLKPEGETKTTLAGLLQNLEGATGFRRILILCTCLQTMMDEKKKRLLSTEEMNLQNEKYKQRLDAVFQFTIANFQQPVTLSQVAKLANMSVTAFCAYFKKSTRKSYVEFLNEIRIGYACRLLQDTDKAVIDICYESGFNTSVNFNKQFSKLMKMPPREFRANFLSSIQ